MANCKTCPASAGFLMYGIADTICDHQDLFDAMQHHQAPENSGFNTLRLF
ncbi:MAG: hypothetical protein IPO94_15745 [Saprospiraceae bacterium]|nr:hypothetical protein [Saprospiraceae bacterium]